MRPPKFSQRIIMIVTVCISDQTYTANVQYYNSANVLKSKQYLVKYDKLIKSIYNPTYYKISREIIVKEGQRIKTHNGKEKRRTKC